MKAQHWDLGDIQARLSSWFSGKLSTARDLSLSGLDRPSGGLSNETIFGRLSWREDDRDLSRNLVIRLEPKDFQVFPDYDLSRQFNIMSRLAETPVPVPPVLWLEEDADILGNPFYVMERIDGEIASEVPPYHTFGLCFDASPERRAAMWRNGIEAMAAIHSLDWEKLGLSFMAVPTGGANALDPQLVYYESFFNWAKGQEPQPVLDAALAWLKKNRFTPSRVSLCWGDSRLPNLIFRDDRVVGVLDWEMAFLGDPEADLAWWIFQDWQHSEGYGIPRLEGFPGPEETVRYYEELTGRRVEHYLYHEVMAAFRFGVIMLRVAERMKAQGIPTPTRNFASNNPCTQRLASLLQLPPPGDPARERTNIQERTVSVQFHLTGDGGCDWYLVSEQGEGKRHEGTVENPDVTLTVSAADWDAIQNRTLDRSQAYLGGSLKVEGDLTLLMQLEDVISKLSGEGQR
ncbi:MAG: phosphotransferase [Dehalococcoidia bacterium]